MRVSTAQFYFQSTQQFGGLQTKVNEHAEHLSSGKRIMTAKDDAVAFGTLAGLKEGQSSIDKYQRNIIQAENRNTLQDISFSSAEDVMQQLKQTFIQANNGSLSDDDLTALGALAKNALEELLNIANTTDETGGYIFSGYQVDDTPFVMQTDNTVNYLGDGGVRELQIAKNVMVDMNQSGDAAFLKVANTKGDFSTQYNANTSGISVNSAVINDPSTYDTLNNPPGYNFNFTSATDLNVTDSLGNPVFTTNAYAPGQTIAFNGVEVKLSGNPLPADDFTITPAEDISVFDTVKGVMDWINTGTSPANPTQHSVDYQVLLEQLDQATSHMTTGRVGAGVRLNLIENQESNHLDTELYLAKGVSAIEDLDFAKTAADFERSKFSLQAAQQTFVQIKNLSLFNYL